MYPNRPITQAHDGQVIVGIKKDLQNVSSVPIGGSTFTLATIETLLQSRIDAANAVDVARAKWLEATATYQALNAQVTPVVRGLRRFVIDAFGENSPVLADFGFSPPKKAVLTPEQNVAKALKAAATRKARGTMGKKEKLKIKGTVATTAPETPASPVPSPAPTATAPTNPVGVVTAAPPSVTQQK
jgi:hypothetical protein